MSEYSWMYQDPADPASPIPDYWGVEWDWDEDGSWELPNVVDMDGLLVCQCETVELARQLCEKHNARVKEAEDAKTR
jgi:hypothetical protein